MGDEWVESNQGTDSLNTRLSNVLILVFCVVTLKR